MATAAAATFKYLFDVFRNVLITSYRFASKLNQMQFIQKCDAV